MLKDQKELLELFNAHGVEYMVIGGHAVGAHAEPRLTKDLDLLVRNSPENSVKVFHALARFGAPLSGMTAEDFCEKPTQMFQFGVPPARIDILQSLEGVSMKDIWTRVIRREIIPGLEADFIGLDDLIANKSAVGRPQDVADVAQLQEIKRLD